MLKLLDNVYLAVFLSLQMWGFARPAVLSSWLSAAFPLCFFCLIHLFIFPVWQAITWQGQRLPRSGQQPAAHAQQNYRKHTPWVRDVGKGPVQQGYVQPFLQHVSSGPPVNSFALTGTRKGTTESNFLPSISQINNRPMAHEDIKMCIPCIIVCSSSILWVIEQCLKNVGKTGVHRQHQYTHCSELQASAQVQ